MTLTSDSTGATAPPRNLPLGAARIVAGLVGALQATGALYFGIIAPDEAVWLGPLIDIPVLTLLFVGILLKLVTALAPGLTAARRIRLGLAAVGLSVVATLVKVPLYDEPEGLTFVAVDAVLLTLLLLAARTSRPSSQ